MFPSCPVVVRDEQDANSKDSGSRSLLSKQSSPNGLNPAAPGKTIDSEYGGKKNLRLPLRSRINDSDSSFECKPLLESPVTSRNRSNVLHAGLFDFENIEMTTSETEVTSYGQERSRRTHSEEPSRRPGKRSLSSVELKEKRTKISAESIAVEADDFDSHIDDDVFALSEHESPNVSTYSVHSEHRSSCAMMRCTSCSVLEMHSAHSPRLPPVFEVHYSLPSVEKPQKESLAFRSISAMTLANELRRLGSDKFSEQYMVIDCRYPYEYEGGHVKTAINVHDQDQIEKLFFPKNTERIPIFYCEFSQKRGPGMALKVRSIDRKRNELAYPNVDYKEMYILDRGYRNLWQDGSFKDICDPQSYTPMEQEEHRSKLKTFKWHKSRSSQSIGRIGISRANGRKPSSRRGLFVENREMFCESISIDAKLTQRSKSMILSMEEGPESAAPSPGISVPSLLDFDSSLEE